MNSFGRIFRITLFGESHGEVVGVTIGGVPAGISLSVEDFYSDLNRRKAGAKGTTSRIESDNPNIVSGYYNGFTTGAPLTILFQNENIQSEAYDEMLTIPRPGHADFVATKKFKGFNDHRGGGHFSGRLTLPLVAAGVVAKKLLGQIEISSRIVSVGGNSDVETAVNQALAQGDSVGGIVECAAKNIPVGWGEPFFDGVESHISHLAFAVPAIKGVEFGAGFKAASMLGSQHNDTIEDEIGQTATNHAGGVVGGLTNGNDLVFRVAVKPTPSISKEQQSFNFKTGKQEKFNIEGRHDACIALRMPVIIEAITAVVLADFCLLANR